MIRAITFDFWDTLAIDGSDEPKRAAKGLPPKPEARLRAISTEITRYHPAITAEKITEAYERANAHFRHQWQVEPAGKR